MPVLPQEPVLFPDSSFGPALTPTRGEGRVSYTRPGPGKARPGTRACEKSAPSFLSNSVRPTHAHTRHDGRSSPATSSRKDTPNRDGPRRRPTRWRAAGSWPVAFGNRG
jgi:hypothetical protein